MSVNSNSPKARRSKRGARPAGMPVVYVQKKKSGSGGLVMTLILLAALGGGGFIYYNQQQNAAALAAKQQKMEENAKIMEQNERNFAEAEAKKKGRRAARAATTATEETAMGAVSETPAVNDTPAVETTSTPAPVEEETVTVKSAMGTTTMTKRDGQFAVEDTTPPPFDLKAEGIVAKKVMEKLDKAIDEAGDGDTFHDLQADLKRSFELTQPGIFTDEKVIPAYPDKEQKLLRLAQGVYVCLNLAAELNAQNTVSDKDHAKFVNWLMKDKAKAARTFTYGLEHYNITDVATATVLLEELRAAHMKSPSSAMKKIPTVVKKGAKN